MKISLQWINEFVDIKSYMTDPQGLADLLTKAGLEVEEIQNKAKDFQHVVIGHITVKDKHPNADKLSLCQVEIAPGQTAQIVCGAQNHKAGDKVIVALPGAVLPGNFVIKKSLEISVGKDKIKREFEHLSLLWNFGCRLIPKPETCKENIAVYSFIDATNPKYLLDKHYNFINEFFIINIFF